MHPEGKIDLTLSPPETYPPATEETLLFQSQFTILSQPMDTLLDRANKGLNQVTSPLILTSTQMERVMSELERAYHIDPIAYSSRSGFEKLLAWATNSSIPQGVVRKLINTENYEGIGEFILMMGRRDMVAQMNNKAHQTASLSQMMLVDDIPLRDPENIARIAVSTRFGSLKHMIDFFNPPMQEWMSNDMYSLVDVAPEELVQSFFERSRAYYLSVANKSLVTFDEMRALSRKDLKAALDQTLLLQRFINHLEPGERMKEKFPASVWGKVEKTRRVDLSMHFNVKRLLAFGYLGLSPFVWSDPDDYEQSFNSFANQVRDGQIRLINFNDIPTGYREYMDEDKKPKGGWWD